MHLTDPQAGRIGVKDYEALQREFARVNVLTCFDRTQRIWWIYLLCAVEHWLARNEDPGVRAAYGQLKALPENLPDEADRWVELRAAVGKVLVATERH
jgi:hypothetical protein